jgi:hypothetical protein
VSLSDDELLRRPIFVIGAPRSGTTVLSEILEAHLDVALIGEPRLTWRHGNEGKSDMFAPEDARPEVARYIRCTFAAELRRQGARRMVEKTPSNALRIGFVDRIFPDARYVHIVRDGRDAALSIREFWRAYSGGLPAKQLRQRLRELDPRRAPHYAREVLRRALPAGFARWVGPRTWGPRIPGLNELVSDLDILAVCCLQWRMSVESACYHGRALPAERYFECRLEDFSVDVVGEILKFCALEDDPSVHDQVAQRFDGSRTNNRRPLATAEEERILEEWLRPTLKWLGYE